MPFIDPDFVTALKWCTNFMYNFVDIENIDVGSVDEEDLTFQLIMAKIDYFHHLEEICEKFKMDSIGESEG